MPRPKLTPEIAYKLARRLYEATGERNMHLESMIIQDPYVAYMYARRVLKAPWPEAESVIAQNPVWAYWYTRELLKDHRFFDAEPVIAQDPGTACDYAKYILKAPWPEAEITIAQDTGWAHLYVRDVLETSEDYARTGVSI